MRGATSGPTAPGGLGIPLSSEEEGRPYRAYPSLSRARWLFPADTPIVRRVGIGQLFQPSSLKGRVLKRLISAGGLPGGKVSLSGESLSRLEAELADALSEPEVKVAFYLGVPGAYRKVTAQVMTPGGDSLAFAKIATSRLTQAHVEDERRVLLRLYESEGLRGKVPEVLRYFAWDQSKVLLMTGGPPQPGPKDLSSAHLELCREVFLPFAETHAFGESSMMTRMSEALSRSGPHLPDPWFTRLDQALERLRNELGSVALPLSLAHRDFAPWNTRVGPRGLFVFDWDSGAEGMTPLYDMFHFQAIQSALLGRPEHLPDRHLLRDLIDALWPEGHRYLPWLYLSYLVDMSLLYSEAQVVAPGVGEQRVWSWFGDQLDSFLTKGSPL